GCGSSSQARTGPMSESVESGSAVGSRSPGIDDELARGWVAQGGGPCASGAGPGRGAAGLPALAPVGAGPMGSPGVVCHHDVAVWVGASGASPASAAVD